jgi:hypothetical protein
MGKRTSKIAVITGGLRPQSASRPKGPNFGPGQKTGSLFASLTSGETIPVTGIAPMATKTGNSTLVA